MGSSWLRLEFISTPIGKECLMSLKMIIFYFILRHSLRLTQAWAQWAYFRAQLYKKGGVSIPFVGSRLLWHVLHHKQPVEQGKARAMRVPREQTNKHAHKNSGFHDQVGLDEAFQRPPGESLGWYSNPNQPNSWMSHSGPAHLQNILAFLLNMLGQAKPGQAGLEHRLGPGLFN